MQSRPTLTWRADFVADAAILILGFPVVDPIVELLQALLQGLREPAPAEPSHLSLGPALFVGAGDTSWQ